MYDKFLKDLERSAPHEARTANLVIRKYKRTIRDLQFTCEADLYEEMKAKDFIVTFEEGQVMFEHKADFKATQTWNLAIEHMCNNTRSGLASTKAQVWISSVQEPQTGIWRAYYVNVQALRKILFSDQFPALCQPNMKTRGLYEDSYWHKLDSNWASGDKSSSCFFRLCIEMHIETHKDLWGRLDLAEDGSIDWLLVAADK